jgi:hypothetical protein
MLGFVRERMELNWRFLQKEIKFGMDRDSSVSLTTCYGLDGPGIESRQRRDLQQPSRPALGPTQPLIQWVPGLTRG